ncbi:carboxylate-amine ligase [Actinomycetospora cinnamomea]|uniref:Putative glutamate--cysteine ligase 2 n=1 Tax=Actinomycetospora cinnamomea TaxID=663609 RepID=A0A2U1EZF9_9PSEU|nr:glutamate--cysteine ligase [Actinomycetospora cinnamomea]PVZ05306.1 carboxylate-amine ligase [Actinomycetospora cinnamomea]
MTGVPPFGAEEELLLVDPVSGAPRGRAGAVRDEADGELDGEMRTEQVETATAPHADAAALAADLRRRRREAREAARAAGVDVAGLATSPVAPDEGAEPAAVPDGRYGRIAERFGAIATAQLTSGQHVHVEVGSLEEGVGVLDHIGVWLPVLRALAANSPCWRGRDTSYASYRTIVWSRWPSAGPTRVFGSLAAYDAAVAAMLSTDTLLDEAMVYFDARLSRELGTVEVRVTDVALEIDDAVLVAVLARALVTTAARDWRDGVAPRDEPVEALRLAHWRAARWGLTGELVDPRTGKPAPAEEVLNALQDHVAGALADAGDADLAAAGCARLLASGTGSVRQRAAVEAAGGDPAAAVHDARERFLPAPM